MQLALRNGASADPAIDGLWQRLQSERLTGMTMLARHLVASGHIRSGVEVDDVRDILWTCISIEVYDLLVLRRGWTRGIRRVGRPDPDRLDRGRPTPVGGRRQDAFRPEHP